MNYEELLASRNGAALKKDAMPFGSLYKKMTETSYVNVLELRHELADSIRFCEALKAESEMTATLKNHHQLHFQVSIDSSGLCRVTVEQGNCRTFERLIEEKPAIVASKNFVERIMTSLVETTENLNKQGIYHICFAPSNILVRKGDDTPLLLFHGSNYLLLNDQETLYGDYKDFVAPEVLEEGTADARSEVYSLGLFMKYLYRESDIPLEYRGVISKATQAEPEKRYKSPADMLKAMTSRRSLRSTAMMALVAALVTALAIVVYMQLVPSPEDIEFVEPAPKEEFGEEMYPEEYDPAMELDAVTPDSNAVKVDERQMKVYEAKAEQIFRKQFAREAERILSKIYDNEHMNSSEKKFLSESRSVMEELTKKQIDLGSNAGLSDAKSQRIASEIIERITNEKKKKLEQLGVQKGENE